jgi:hypothetical protein
MHVCDESDVSVLGHLFLKINCAKVIKLLCYYVITNLILVITCILVQLFNKLHKQFNSLIETRKMVHFME